MDEVRLTLEDGRVVARCACGGWTASVPAPEPFVEDGLASWAAEASRAHRHEAH